MLEGVYMKSAKEMFEELGYKLIQDDAIWLIYNFDNKFNIEFYKPQQNIHVGTKEALFSTIYTDDLQAINKQIEELGWLDK